MIVLSSQVTGNSIVCLTACSGWESSVFLCEENQSVTGYMMSEILINSGSSNGLVPDSAKSLPETSVKLLPDFSGDYELMYHIIISTSIKDVCRFFYWYWNWNFPGWLSHDYFYWCLGSFCHQVSSSHYTDCGKSGTLSSVKKNNFN